MKKLNDENIIPQPEACADAVMEVVPLLMTTMRRVFRALRPVELTLPQFRTLAFIDTHSGSSLTAVAEHIGLSISSASKLVTVLAERHLVRHTVSRRDRRQAKLALTVRGRALLATVHDGLHAMLTDSFTSLADAERQAVILAMAGLERTLCPSPDEESTLETFPEKDRHTA